MISIRDVFVNWRSCLDVASRYTYENRKDSITELIGDIVTLGFKKEEAESIKHDVVKTLITKEGMKNTGKYKGWKDNVIDEFDNAIVDFYVKDVIDRIKDIKEISGEYRFGVNEKIVEYLYSSYSKVTELMIIEAHTSGTFLNGDFIKTL